MVKVGGDVCSVAKQVGNGSCLCVCVHVNACVARPHAHISPNVDLLNIWRPHQIRACNRNSLGVFFDFSSCLTWLHDLPFLFHSAVSLLVKYSSSFLFPLLFQDAVLIS